jgi:hypothetical protein
MLLKAADRILVAHRRLFEKDVVRFFVGEVEAYDAVAADLELRMTDGKGFTMNRDMPGASR